MHFNVLPKGLLLSTTTLECYVQGQPDACTVLVKFAEKGRLNLHAGTYVNGNDGATLPCVTEAQKQ